MLMASDIWSVWILLEPCRGRSDTIVYWPEPCGAWQVEMLTGVPAFAPPPPLELLPLLPQPATTAARAPPPAPAASSHCQRKDCNDRYGSESNRPHPVPPSSGIGVPGRSG